MSKHRYFAFFAVFAAMAFSANAAWSDDKPPAKDSERQLVAVLQSDAAPQEKAIACKNLAVCGTEEAVPALAALLADEQLASWARIALEAIPDPAADDALRDALGKLRGNLLVGAINSLGARRDAKATELLAARLKDADAEVASAAAVALGRIGAPAAAKALEQALPGAPAAVRAAIAEGCIRCAEKCLADGKADAAIALYDLVRKTDLPTQCVLSATRGSILARKSAGVPLLIEQLQSPDKANFALGLRVARELPGGEVTDALVAESARMNPERQALLIVALADRHDALVLPAIRQAAKSGPAPVRLAALGALERIGDKSCVSVLLEAAAAAEEELAQAALAALAEMRDEAVDADLAARLPKAEGKTRLALIQLAGQRRIAAANPALLAAVEDSDAAVRAAALAALGSVVELDGLSVLLAQVAHPQRPGEERAALEALSAACTRMSDREACAEKLVAVVPELPVPAACGILKILSAVGGAKALAAVGAAAKSPHPEIRDAAGGLLGGWMTADAAPVLLDLAKTAAEEKYRIRALRGYLRIARQFALPDPQRTEMCRHALKAATRGQEKKMVLEILARYPSLGMLNVALEAKRDPALADDAARCVLTVAQKIGGDPEEVRKLLSAAGYEPVKVEIVKAEYGAGNRFKDVTAILRRQVGDYPLIVLRSPSYNTSFAGDPAPSTPKKLSIQYIINGKPGEVSLPEDAPVLLPMTK
ncbi:MAG: HEAT repeat domain-containing protein [Pirellulales bacterium]|nr:HEAT repeat domain-containing protein [Pirellulales bacterium]